MRRSYDNNPGKAFSHIHIRDVEDRERIERRDIATAGAVDLKIKQDLFAKDIAYEGTSKTHLSQQSEREKEPLKA